MCAFTNVQSRRHHILGTQFLCALASFLGSAADGTEALGGKGGIVRLLLSFPELTDKRLENVLVCDIFGLLHLDNWQDPDGRTFLDLATCMMLGHVAVGRASIRAYVLDIVSWKKFRWTPNTVGHGTKTKTHACYGAAIGDFGTNSTSPTNSNKL